MLHSVLMVIHVFCAVAIIALVLFQRGKGADAGAGFGAGASGNTGAILNVSDVESNIPPAIGGDNTSTNLPLLFDSVGSNIFFCISSGII